MTDAHAPRTFREDFRRFFLRGLVVLLPSVLTLWIVVKAYQFVDTAIAEPINRGVRLAIVATTPGWEPFRKKFEPTDLAMAEERERMATARLTVPKDDALRLRLRRESVGRWWRDHWYMDLIGLVVAIVAVYLSGRLLGSFVGRRVARRVEGFITTVPILKQVYPSVKQVVDFLFADEQPIKFNRVVACEYPRKGVWSVGFLTGDSMAGIRDKAGDVVSIFIPSSPTPFTGYVVSLPRSELIELPLSVDEAIRFAVSGGVLVPPSQQSAAARAQAAPTLVLPEREGARTSPNPPDAPPG